MERLSKIIIPSLQLLSKSAGWYRLDLAFVMGGQPRWRAEWTI